MKPRERAAVQAFQVDLAALALQAGGSVGEFKQKVAIDLFTSITVRTPTDTGRARASWRVGIGQPVTSVEPEGEQEYNYEEKNGRQQAKLTKGIKIGKAGKSNAYLDAATGLAFQPIFITNSLPYINALENGHSKIQAPYGMVAIAMAEAEAGISMLGGENV